MLAEAESEQETGARAEVEEVALVVIAVLERVVVEGFGHDRLHPVARDVGAQGPHVRPHLRVGRAQLREAGIAEGRSLRVLGPPIAGPVAVEEHRPRVNRHSPAHGRVHEAGQHVFVTDQ